MNSKPRVSVIMPAYNVEKYVAEAIESILNQTFNDFEFIIINDGSTDNTPKIIKEYEKKDKRIHFINRANNIGFIGTLNECLDVAKGEYIAKMDSDDISMPERLKCQVEFLDNNPDIGMVGVGVRKFGSVNRTDIRPARPGLVDFMYRCAVTVFMARRDIIEKAHLRFDRNYFAAEDYEFYSRFARYAKIANIPDVLYKYRWHGDNVSVQKHERQLQSERQIKKDVATFLTGDEYLIDRFNTTFHWLRIFGIPLIKIKTYNLMRSKYYLFGFIPLVLSDRGHIYLFGFIKIGIIK